MALSRTPAHVGGAVALTAGLLTAVFTGTAGACSCLPGGEAEKYARADHVFVGLVLSETLEANDPAVSYDDRYVYAVRTGEEHKGDVPRRVEVTTSTSGASCGIRLAVGTRYLVFAHGDAADRRVESQYCSGTRPASAGPPSTGPTSPTTTTPPTTPCATAAP